jgi:hypothetical protein
MRHFVAYVLPAFASKPKAQTKVTLDAGPIKTTSADPGITGPHPANVLVA